MNKPLDQVVAIQEDSKHDRSIVIRTGISSSDLSGKTWKIVSAAISLDFQVSKELDLKTDLNFHNV